MRILSAVAGAWSILSGMGGFEGMTLRASKEYGVGDIT